MKTRKLSRLLSAVLASAMVIGSVGVNVRAQDAVAAVPDPYYEFTFDEGMDEEHKVKNEGSAGEVLATVEGVWERDGQPSGLGVEEDGQRASMVLNLPGGQTNGSKEGRLTLPDHMFQEVTDAGFAFSFWINIDGEAAQYSRIFSATVNGQNSDDGWPWTAPEFAFVAGSESASDLGDGQSGYHTAIVLPDKTELKLVWEQQFAKGRWQHVTISVSPQSYDVYLDGQKVNILYDRNNNTSAVLQKLFADGAALLKQYQYSGIGPSVYKTDKDLKAKVDEFRFYNTALTEAQAKAAYDSYAVSSYLLDGLSQELDSAKAKHISFYTKESFEAYQVTVAKAQEEFDHPVTNASVEKATNDLKAAGNALVYFEGITADTAFSNAQLQKETREAKALLASGALSSESEASIGEAVQTAQEALGLTNQDAAAQKAVDDALAALRAAVDAKTFGATLHFDADPQNAKSEVLHGSTGFLYGVSEINVPSADLLTAIAPKILVQKAADGKQHPSGDGYRLTQFLDASGVENIQIYLQDYYLEWPYESNGIDDYNEKVQTIVRRMVDGKTPEERAKYSFVLFNEPDGIWYGNDVSRLCNDWLKIYTTVKSIDENLKVAGPNYSTYRSDAYRTFFDFCQKNNCLPEYITWHELQKDKLTSFKSHSDEVKSYVRTYYADSDIEPVLFVNETVNFDDIGNPGALVNWLAIFDEEDVYASLPYWGLANSMNELAADTNKPNGAWWVYRWYAQMTGKKAPLTLENIENPSAYGRLYGLTSVDDSEKTVYSLFGGQAGKQTVNIEHITSTDTFAGADKAHVKIYRTKYTGHHGFAEETPVVFDGNLALNGDDLTIAVQDAELMDAYFAVITPATKEAASDIASYDKNWEKTYEAENAELIGNARAFTKTGGGDLARSNRAEVGGINAETDGVEFTVNVPEDGRYRLNVYYSSQAPQVDPMTLEYVASGGQNRAVGARSSHILTVDGQNPQEIVYDSTVKWGYYNYKTVYVDLNAGEHKIRLMYKGEDQNGKQEKSMLCALLDKIDLAFAPDVPAVVQIEARELAGAQAGYTMSQNADGVTGSGKLEFVVNAPRDGYYTVSAAGSGNASLSKSRVNYAKDAKAESEVSVDWMKLFDLALGEQSGKVYLTAGVNRLNLDGNGITVKQITFTESADETDGSVAVIEAEDCKRTGTDAQDEYNYLPGSAATPGVVESAYASGKKAVEGFRGGKDNELSFAVKVSKAGNYKLSVVYSNNEPAPVMKTAAGKDYVHPYNTDLVERYAQISVNGAAPQTVYFRNTLCWDTYKNTVIDVALQEGSNIITFTNDNSYKFSAAQDDFTPRMDQFIVAAAAAEKGEALPTVKEENGQTPVKDPANKSKLAASIQAAEAKRADKDKYTAESWAKLEDALKTAAAVNAKADATQQEVDDAQKALDEAVAALAEKNEKPPVTVKTDFGALNQAIADAKKYKAADYTVASFKVLQNALQAAQEIAKRADATQEQADSAEKRLLQAVKDLVKLRVESTKKVTLGVKEKYSVSAKNCTYTTSNAKVASVNAKGSVTAKKTGNATIKATDTSGKVRVYQITVKKAPNKISVSPSKKTLKKGKKVTLKVKLPKGTAGAYTFKSNKPKVASVNKKGVVAAKKKGTAKITVKTYNGKKKTVTIKVK